MNNKDKLYKYKAYVKDVYDGDTITVDISLGFHVTMTDIKVRLVGIDTPEVTALNQSTTIGTSVSKTVVGTTINLRATTVNTLFGSNNVLRATLTVVGRDSGARLTIPVQINKV